MRLPVRARRSPEVTVDLAELSADPYPVWRRLRRVAPVVVIQAGRPLWFVTRWDDVRDVVVDDETFRSQLDPLPAALVGAMPFTDGERHERARAAIQPQLAPRRSAAFADSTVPELADELLDSLAETPGGDLMAQYAEPLAAATIRRLLSLDTMELPELLVWRDRVAASFLGVLSGSGAREEEHPDDEARSALDTLVLAGIDGFRDAVAQTLLGLLLHPGQIELAQSGLDPCRKAVEEGARWLSPVHTVLRRADADVRLASVTVPAGTTLAVSLGSANRDENHWREPDRFDLERDEGMHLAFAPGRHHCLGQWLARQGAAIAVGRALERFPSLRLDPSRPPTTGGWAFHRVHALPALWD